MASQVLVAITIVGFATTTAAQRSDTRTAELEPPVRLTADGELIDTGKDIGHSGPLFCDYDGDGKNELLVGSFRGNIRVFENVGTAHEPRFEEADPLEAGGEPIRIHNW